MTRSGAPPTLASLHQSILDRHAERTAIRFRDASYTYADLDRESATLGAALDSLGLGHEDRVGLLMSNRPEYTVAEMALARTGLAKVPLNDMLTTDDIRYMLDNADTKTAIVGPNFVDTIETVAPDVPSLEQIITIDAAGPDLRYESLIADHDPAIPDRPITGDTLAGIFHTGGTTGDPKGVKHTQRNLSLNALAHAIELEIRPQETLLLMTPLPHSAGLIMAGGLTQGSTHVLTQGFDAEQALSLIDREAVSWTFMVPTMIYQVLDRLPTDAHDIDSLHTLVYGAAPMKPARLREGLDKLGDVFVQFYGQYETPDLITVLPKHAHDPANEQRLSSCGLPTTMCQVKIVDDDGNPCPPGEPGEILSRGAYTMEGYYELPDTTAETMTEDGWVHTGDIGKMDEDGFVYILDRDSDVIVSGGMNVYSVQVEDVIQQHDQVDNVAVIAVPHEKWGEAVHAVVVPADDSADADSIKAFCEGRLADYKRPKSVEFIDELPTTPYGKLDKKRLREPYWDDKERNVG